jgi:20S proteasome alpha/beta subunit
MQRLLNLKSEGAFERNSHLWWLPFLGRASVVFGLAITPILFCGSSTPSDAGHYRESGTLIVWDPSPDAVVIAADSRIGKPLDRPEAGDNRLQCKIVELGSHLAFAVAGIVRADPSVDAFRKALGGTWEASEAMRNIVAKRNADPDEDKISGMANEFGAEYARVLTIIAAYDPSSPSFSNPTSAHLSGETQGGNTAILWGIDKSNQITIIKINLKQEKPSLGPFTYSLDIRHPAFVGDSIAATGSGAHFAGLAINGSLQLQARTHNQTTVEDMIKFVKDWTTAAIEQGPLDADFGGPVDIAVVSKNQNFRWIQQKPVCNAGKPLRP